MSRWFFILWVMCGLLLLWRLTIVQWRFSKKLSLLKDIQLSPNTKWPSVSLIVPACNEASTVGAALESLLKMDYPELQIIVVNDRSTDGTRTVLEGLSAKYPQLKIIHIDQLPKGWLGKNHALQCGTELAKGEWLLFTDADVHFSVNSLKKAITFVESEKLDFLTVCPAIHAPGFILKIFIAQFNKVLSWGLNLDKLRDPRERQAMGIGAFNLVRSSVLRESRGFEWLKMEVIDDLGLATMLKEEKKRLGFLGGIREIEVEWYPSFWQLVRGLEKNSFSVIQYSWLAVFINIILAWASFLALFFIPWWVGSLELWGLIGLSLLIYLWTAAMVLIKLLPFRWISLLLTPLAQVVFPLITLRSALLFSVRGGMYWRGTFYSARDLKKMQRVKILDQIWNSKF